MNRLVFLTNKYSLVSVNLIRDHDKEDSELIINLNKIYDYNAQTREFSVLNKNSITQTKKDTVLSYVVNNNQVSDISCKEPHIIVKPKNKHIYVYGENSEKGKNKVYFKEGIIKNLSKTTIEDYILNCYESEESQFIIGNSIFDVSDDSLKLVNKLKLNLQDLFGMMGQTEIFVNKKYLK